MFGIVIGGGQKHLYKMARKVLRWSMIKMITMIMQILNSKFDCFIVIEGNRGLGKSTLAIHLARGVAREMKKHGYKTHKFSWKRSLLYTKREVLQFFDKWRVTGIADEMINVTFNRDFYDADQKNIIKMINMNRDHGNLFIACVPQFQALDNQIKNLCKIRITVVKRGMAIIQTPNKTIYVKDKWDQATNEKVERGWLAKGITKPHYSKLTTFRGVIKFPKLREGAEEKYQQVKDEKRNEVARDQMGLQDEKEKEDDPYEKTIKDLLDGKVRNGIYLDGLAGAYGIKPDSFRRALINKLKKKGKPHRISDYYWDDKKNRDKLKEDQLKKSIKNKLNGGV